MSNEITITMPEQPADQTALTERGTSWAAAVEIKTSTDRITASAGVAGLKNAVKQITELFAESKTAANAAHKAVCAAEKKLAEPITAAIIIVNDKMLAYDRKEAAIRAQEQRRLQAAAQAQADAEKRRLAAIAARCKDETKKEAYTEAAAAVVPVAVTIAPPPKAEGEIVRKVWKARLVSIEMLIAAAKTDQTAAMMLAFDQTAANKAAAMFKRNGVVDGVEFYEESQITHRG